VRVAPDAVAEAVLDPDPAARKVASESPAEQHLVGGTDLIVVEAPSMTERRCLKAALFIDQNAPVAAGELDREAHDLDRSSVIAQRDPVVLGGASLHCRSSRCGVCRLSDPCHEESPRHRRHQNHPNAHRRLLVFVSPVVRQQA
jgi:hypothetical protein